MSEKYKMFRNYMVNELGISKEDIKEWTKEAITTEVEKLIGQIDVDGMVRNAVNNAHYNEEMKRLVATKIATELQRRIQIV